MRKHTQTHNYLQKFIASALFNDGFYDRLRVFKTIFLKKFHKQSDPIFQISNSLLSAGDSVLDIGANIGQSAIYFSDVVGNNGKVFSIEPVKRNYTALLYMIRTMGLKNVICINCAVSDNEGNEKILIPLLNKKLEIGTQAVLEKNKKTYFENYLSEIVSCDTIDGLGKIYDFARLKLIKCDTEGAEIRVLNGGRNTISKYKPIIVLEISLNNPELKILLDQNYLPFYVVNRKLVPAYKSKLKQDPIFIHKTQIEIIFNKLK